QHAVGNNRLGQKDAAPDLAKAIVRHPQLQKLGEFPDKILWGDLAGLESMHEIGSADASRNFRRPVVTQALQRAISTVEIEGHDDSAQIEDHGLDHFYQNPSSFHHAKPTVDQMTTLAMDAANPAVDHVRNET